MTAIPNFFIGQQVTVMAARGQSVATDGTVTDTGVTYDLAYLGVLDKASFRFHVQHDEISPCTTRFENNVIIKEGIEASLEEIIPVGGQSNLLALMLSYDYIKLTFAASAAEMGYTGTDKTTTVTAWLVRGDTGYEIDRGKSVANMSLKTAGVPVSVLFTP